MNVAGRNLILTVFGQSHSRSIGCVLDGLPPGEPIDRERLSAFMKRRMFGKEGSTKRMEADEVEFVSGVYAGKTCGAPLAMSIRNADISDSGDDWNPEAKGVRVFRPGQSDLTAHLKWRGHEDARSGGCLSARLTAALAAAGGVCKLVAERRYGVRVSARALEVGGVRDCPDFSEDVSRKEYPVVSAVAVSDMLAAVRDASAAGDSLGGIVECAADGVPAGIGSPVFDGVENVISRNVFAIPSVKGVEFGEGFALSAMRGSDANGSISFAEGRFSVDGDLSGGILGGIATGGRILFRVVLKPVPSISLAQKTVNSDGEAVRLSVSGKNDVCAVFRAVPVVEAMAAFSILDLILGC